jgi:hypothetical protein
MRHFLTAFLLTNAFVDVTQAQSRVLPESDLRCSAAPTRDCALALVRADADEATTFSRVEINAALSGAFAEIGRFDQAFAAADAITHAPNREVAYWKITRIMLRAGRLADVLERLRSAPANAFGVFRAGIERDVADALIAGGRLDEALAAARALERPAQRAVTLARIGGRQRNATLFQEAEDVIASMGPGWERAWAVFELARAGGSAAMLERARADARLLREPSHLGILAAQISPLGFDEATRAITAEIRALALATDHPANRLKALLHLASVTRDTADFRAAMAAADSLPAPFSGLKGAFLFQIGEEQVRAGLYRDAVDTARSVRAFGRPDDLVQSRGMLHHERLFIGLIARAAEGLRDRALFADAKAAARAQEVLVLRDMHLATIARHEFAAGLRQMASQPPTVSKLPSPASKSSPRLSAA